MDSSDVHRAVAAMTRTLGPHVERDWRVRAGPLEWSCWTTAAHVAHDLLAYAGQLAGRAADGYLPFDLTVRPDASPAAVLTVVEAAAGLLGGALDRADPGTRAWHWGPTDPGGFAAMGVTEILVHTYDIGAGLALDWLPPEELAARALARLFPDAPPGDPARALLWCTGRIEFDGRARRTSWSWRASMDEEEAEGKR
ncbi:maleylpyruvate isomerase N-terminal domain-containing protein [Micromonospora sp. NPDC049559]|uniref:maleylpyruvate isomerase N-terminal domain-containing protein n=1 Tax=Micromonospora sp. NPDC049559 TaxID=3155923 RepID=UPI0034229582